MNMRRLRNVHRPGIAVTVPTFSGPIVLIDVGANIGIITELVDKARICNHADKVPIWAASAPVGQSPRQRPPVRRRESRPSQYGAASRPHAVQSRSPLAAQPPQGFPTWSSYSCQPAREGHGLRRTPLYS